jgi:hypothetical protein
MIPKKQNGKNDPKNYRPISITPNLAKLNEKIVNKRLKRFLETKNILAKIQSGFRQHRQTKDNLCYLIQKTSESFNRKKKVCAIFFDVKAAFDKVWHNGLLFKLTKMSVPLYLIEWIQDFLSDRHFSIKVNGTTSEFKTIKMGVPQGAVLSPLLFSIFINDVPNNSIKNKDYSLLFADDLVYFQIYRSKKIVEKKINDHLSQLGNWFNTWRLSISIQKTNYIVFSKTHMKGDRAH